MPMTLYQASDLVKDPLQGATIAVVGYGNQGRSHALNLSDSGYEVIVGQRPGSSFSRAVADGFAPVSPAEVCSRARLIILGLPDESAAEIYADELSGRLEAGQTIGFIHGFNIRYGYIDPPEGVDVVMVSPKGPGTLLRSLFVDGKGLISLLAVERDHSGHATSTALAWALGLGSGRAGIIKTTFASETETDLFGEQAILCGGLTALMKAAFETLVEAGYEPESAYLECIHELKQIADLVYLEGISAMRQRISNTAEYGDLTRGPIVVDDSTRARMREILHAIQSGAFAKEWISEYRNGATNFHALYQADCDTPLERAGENVRALMPWLQA
ncbi:MAG: ketol-acid reductoisomerase [Phycisphaerae bacterium]